MRGLPLLFFHEHHHQHPILSTKGLSRQEEACGVRTKDRQKGGQVDLSFGKKSGEACLAKNRLYPMRQLLQDHDANLEES